MPFEHNEPPPPTSLSEPHPFRQEFQKVTTVVTEGKVSQGQSEDSSDDKRHITPPLIPAAKSFSLRLSCSPGSSTTIEYERYVTLPSTPAAKSFSLHQSYYSPGSNTTKEYVILFLLQVKLQEDKSKGSILEARTTLEDSRLF